MSGISTKRPHFEVMDELKQKLGSIMNVILPQSVHFGDQANRAAVAKVFAAHPKLFIFARDQESLDFARTDCGCSAALMPDMAHSLWGSLPRHDSNDTRRLNIRRRDPE